MTQKSSRPDHPIRTANKPLVTENSLPPASTHGEDPVRSVTADPTTCKNSLDGLLEIAPRHNLTGLSDGVQAAYAYAPEVWMALAEATIRNLAATGKVFTVDDLRRRGVPDPDIHQRWASVFAVMKHRGVITLAGVGLHRTPGGEQIGIRQWKGAGIGGPKHGRG